MTKDRRMHRHSGALNKRIDKMLEAGRITEEEATRVRAAAGRGEADDVVQQIRLGHVTAMLDAAVEDGAMTREEADALLARVTKGERPRFRRGALRRRDEPPSGES